MTDLAFRRFLTWLAPDGERAAKRYNELHVRLTRLFARQDCEEPAQLADETLDRAIRKVEAVAAGYQGDPEHYVLAVARLVLLEHCRTRRRRWRRAAELERAFSPGPLLPDEQLERRQTFLNRCLAELRPEERALILSYYGERGAARRTRRQGLAEQIRLSDAALRKRTQRIRERLRSKLVASA
jgi:DNA-directed RNA polymerase specialized sigma24 family protein